MPNLFDIVSTFLLDENFLLLFDIANFNFDTFLLFYYCLGIMLVPKYCVGIVWSPNKVIPRISVWDQFWSISVPYIDNVAALML